MTVPAVRINETDNALGVLSATGKLHTIVGTATAGPLNTPSTFSRVKDLQAVFVSGPGVEYAAYYIEHFSLPVCFVRSDTSVASAVSAVTHVATGTTVVTVDSSPAAAPADDFELVLEFLSDGTIGTTGITYRMSLDAGRTWSRTLSLGTATDAAFPDGAGVGFAFAAGTVVTGDLHSATAKAESWNATDLGDALEVLSVSQLSFGMVTLVGGVIDSGTFDTADTVRTFTNGKHAWQGFARLPNAGEADSAYQLALAPLSAAKATKDAIVWSGGSETASAISGRQYTRPGWGASARQAAVAEHINIADTNLGPLPGVAIRDPNGNLRHHDEAINPGLDDLRFGALRTYPRREGVYVNRPRVFAPTGSDFYIMPHRLVMNLAHDLLYDYLLGILHRPILVSRTTGRILGSEATTIRLGGNAVLSAGLLTEPKASDAFFLVGLADNLLQTQKLTCSAKILPLAYPEYIDLELSFTNPALQLQAVG